MSNPYNAAEPAQPFVVDIDVNGTSYTLTPTLSAMKAVNRIGPGLANVFRLLQNYDADAFVAVVVAGIGATGPAVKEVEEGVYRNGLQPLAQHLVHFVSACMNGGRDPDAPTPSADAD